VLTTFTATVVAAEWSNSFYDSFESNVNNWDGDLDHELTTWNRSVSNGTYIWSAKAKNKFIGWASSFPLKITEFSDCFIAVDARELSGPPSASYGLTFRDNNDGAYYVFEITDNAFSFFISQSHISTKLIDRTPSSAIHPYERNRIAVLATGSHFIFYVNNQTVAEFDNDKLSKGKVSLSIEMEFPGDQAIFEFDNFELRSPR
jgi:hypothetical protein